LVDQWRTPQVYTDSWDGRGDNGHSVAEGVYYVVAEVLDGMTEYELDLAASTGQERYPIGHWIENQNGQFRIVFDVPEERGPSELVASVGVVPTDPAAESPRQDMRLCTLLHGRGFGVGRHALAWDGLDASHRRRHNGM